MTISIIIGMVTISLSAVPNARAYPVTATNGTAHSAQSNGRKVQVTMPRKPQSIARTIPADVARFIERRERCDHFRGEDPYNSDRAKFLALKMVETCQGTDVELAGLRAKHRNNHKLMARLYPFDDRIE